MKVNVYNQKGEAVGEVELNSKIFEVKANKHLLAEAVRIQMSNARQSAAHTKTRGEVRGGGKKPWKQKGTGRARVGSIRSPIWRHGGITFGPRSTRNWTLSINKKVKKAALFMGLSDKAADKKFIVIDKLDLPTIKTKVMVEMLNALKKSVKQLGRKNLFVLPKADNVIVKSIRNIAGITYVLANSLNLVDVLKADSIIVLKDSLPVIEKTYLKNEK